MHTIADKMNWYTRKLRLPAIRQNYEALAKQAAKKRDTHEQYLLQLLEMEETQRGQRRRKQRIRKANFPYVKYFQDLSRDDLPKDAQLKLPQIERLDFIKEGRNIILAGNPGTGKTHIAVAIGIKACLADFSVYFTTVHALLTKIREAKSKKTLRLLQAKFERYDLVICDEFGYVSFDKQAAELLFTHLSLRAGKKATVITTNLAFTRWEEIFGDKVLTAAIVDRLTHKAYLVNMNGLSFRVKESQKLAQQ